MLKDDVVEKFLTLAELKHEPLTQPEYAVSQKRDCILSFVYYPVKRGCPLLDISGLIAHVILPLNQSPYLTLLQFKFKSI